MADTKKLVDDLMTLGNALIGNALGARHELKAQAKQKIDFLTQQFDLVSRAEFDAAFAMLAKARLVQDELKDRLEKLEQDLNLSRAKKRGTPPRKPIKSLKVNLPSVKKGKQHIKRK